MVKKKRSGLKIFLLIAGMFGLFLIAIFGLCVVTGMLSDTGSSSYTAGTKGDVAVIPLVGMITREGGVINILGDTSISSKQVVKDLQSAQADDSIKAVVLDINSPGGSALASEEIVNAINRMEKPVVSIIREVGASGGYWAASASDHIIASRLSITGSIGVISSYLEYSGLMDQYGVSYQRMVAGKYKDIGTPYKNLTMDEREILQKKLDRTHEIFVESVADNRKNLNINQVRESATGEFFTGEEAFERGLIDELGSDLELEEHLKVVLEIDTIRYQRYEKKLGFFDLMAGEMSKVLHAFGIGIGQGLLGNGGSQNTMLMMN